MPGPQVRFGPLPIRDRRRRRSQGRV